MKNLPTDLIGPNHPVKSLHGSHSSMVCDTMLHDTLLGFTRIVAGEILLRDTHGYYSTVYSQLDTGLADPNRIANRIS